MQGNMPGNLTNKRIETVSNKAVSYRLAVKPNNVTVLQGAYENSDGLNWFLEWRDIPTVYLDEHGNVKPS